VRHYHTSSISKRVRFPDGWWLDRPLVLGHRGASAHAPANTVAAFRVADGAGAHGVELDVHLTADGVPVVIHDGSVDATTDGHGRVRDMTLREIQQLDAGSHFDAAFAGERIPTLAEALAAMGDRMLVNVELKPQSKGTEDLERAVAKVVYETQMASRVWFSSFKPYSLHQIRRFAWRLSRRWRPSTCTIPCARSGWSIPRIGCVCGWACGRSTMRLWRRSCGPTAWMRLSPMIRRSC